ncbi:MAG: MFS transporter [Anaerolineales bacterium]
MKEKFPYKKTFIVGLGFLGISIIWPIFNSFIPIFLQAGNPEYEKQLLEAGREIPKIIGFGLGPSLAFFVMTWDNLINVFVQPWAGSRSDRTWNQFGRRKPWIIIGAPIAAAAFIFIPFANTILAIMIFILITNFGMALFRSPTVAWLGDLFPAKQRSQANGIINLMGGIGAAVALFGGGILFDNLGRSAPFFAGGIFMLVSLSFALIFVKEPERINPEKQEEKTVSVLDNLRSVWNGNNKNGIYVLLGILLWFMGYEALQTGLSSFSVFSLGLTPGQASIMTTLFAGSFILFAIPSGLIATRIGRKLTISIGLVGMTVLFGLGYFLIDSRITLGIILVLGGFCWALVNVNSLPLVYDYGEETKIGAYTGLYYFSSQTAAVLGPVLSGVLVESLGNNYRMLWIFSTVFLFLAYLAIRPIKNNSTSLSAI